MMGGHVESLDQMTTWAVEKFTDVRNKSIDPPAFEGHALTSNELMVSWKTGKSYWRDKWRQRRMYLQPFFSENHLCQACQGCSFIGYDLPISRSASLVSSTGM
jgi:hypothetical protein